MKLLVLLTLLSAFSCAQIQSVSQTSIPSKKGKVVTATVENNIVFFFNFSNSYIDRLNQDLLAQCSNGKVEGILTKHETKTYFPIVFHKVVITAEGYCNE